MAKVRSLDPHASVDVDQLALRVTLDVIGLVRGGGGLPPGERMVLRLPGDGEGGAPITW